MKDLFIVSTSTGGNEETEMRTTWMIYPDMLESQQQVFWNESACREFTFTTYKSRLLNNGNNNWGKGQIQDF